MKISPLVFAIFLLFFLIQSENASAVWNGLGCVPMGWCNATTYPQYSAECTDFRTLGACHTTVYSCEYQFVNQGTACSTGTCCAGKCGSNLVTDTQCQTPECVISGWTAKNKDDGTACKYNG